jgi:hypothetical protein
LRDLHRQFSRIVRNGTKILCHSTPPFIKWFRLGIFGMEVPMGQARVSAEFLGDTGVERAKECRALASEADAFASTAHNMEMREAYLELKRQWTLLADEIEADMGSGAPLRVPSRHLASGQ